MLRVVIIEDEWMAYEQLSHQLQLLQPQAVIYPQLHTVQSALTFFSQPFPYELVFADIYLQDGTTLELLKQCAISAPVIFTTGHQEHIAEVLAHSSSIDYLVKPFSHEQLAASLNKYVSLRNFFTRQVPGGNAMPAFVAKQRLLVKKGTAYQLLDVADLAYLFSENKVVFAVDCYQQKFLCLETNLSAVMTNLDSTQFFRANRKYGIHLRYLDRFYTDIRSRIILQLKLPGTEPVIISQENAALFRQWLDR